MREIKLTMGFVALVDDESYEDLSKWRWFARKNPGTPCRVYAARNVPRPGKPGLIYMHREVMQAKRGEAVDHLAHREAESIIDNRRSNLRLASKSENNRSRRKTVGKTSSPFKGVYWVKKHRSWNSSIHLGEHHKHFGRFKVEAHAAIAYDLAAVKHFGDFALTNFPVPGSTNWLYGPEVMHG